MLDNWNDVVVTDIGLAMFVKPNTGKPAHNNRPFHGFVINDSSSSKNIYFSDGTTLHCNPYEVHYLPKNSNYIVKNIDIGGCWAINFNLLEEIDEKPFNIKFRNHEAVLKDFKDAVSAWKEKRDNNVVRKCIYDIIIKINKETHRNYTPLKKQQLIKPAVDIINQKFTENDLSIKDMASLCGITEAYFRRIFIDMYSVSPKEYIINLRINYAKQLLETKEFSVTEVASMCGYYEPCHFSREFKKYCGVSPKEFLKNLN